MKNRGLLYLFLSVGILFIGCSKSNKSRESNNSLDKNITITDTKELNQTIPKDAVVSISGVFYTKKDFPKEYSDLKYEGKKRFLSRYIYLKVVLNSLKSKEELYKKEIDIAFNKNRQDLEKKGVVLEPLEKLISTYDIIFNTIAYQEVLKKHKDINREIEDFYKKHDKAYNFPNMSEISHISFKDKTEAEKILKELLDKNITIQDFAKYAQKYTKDLKTISNGGYVGKMGEKELGKDYFNILWKTKEGSLVDTLLTKKEYYHIIYLLKKYPAHKASLKDERENIINFLLSKEIRRWKKEQFIKADKNSRVKVYDIKVDI